MCYNSLKVNSLLRTVVKVLIYTLDEIKEKTAMIFKRYDINKVYIFGSYARNEADDDSDLDFYVDYTNSKVISGLWSITGLRLDLEKTFNKSVDLVTYLPKEDLFKNFINNYERDKVNVYARQ